MRRSPLTGNRLTLGLSVPRERQDFGLARPPPSVAGVCSPRNPNSESQTPFFPWTITCSQCEYHISVIHNNRVTRGLLAHPGNGPWSSWRFYLPRGSFPVSDGPLA